MGKFARFFNRCIAESPRANLHLARWKLKYLFEKLRGNEISGNLPARWAWTKFNRTAVILALIQKIRPERYLEIGCEFNTNFSAIPILHKVGVDPQRGGTHRMTSDAFFASNQESFELIFIDGLHEADQLARDVRNALKCLSPKGAIVLHDMLPTRWRVQHVPRISSEWTGDCWKVAFELAQEADLDFRIITWDHGVGVITWGNRYPKQSFRDFDRTTAEFNFFIENYKKLNLIGFDEFLEELAAE